MPRQSRFCLPGIPHHIVQRGNNRQICFASDKDKAVYINELKKAAIKNQVEIHVWVLMDNHVHLLATPSTAYGLSRMMQDLGRAYVAYFNKIYARTGTLWEGRFKSCLIGSEHHLLQCYRYIEMNPVRAGMVNHPADYTWSSFQCNALGKHSDLVTYHPVYLGLGSTQEERMFNYRELFLGHLSSAALREIRQCLNSGMALGNKTFKDEVEKLLNRRVRPVKPGRPRKIVLK